MCPLRIILIFISATLAGFFVLKSEPQQSDQNASDPHENNSPQVGSALKSGFWTCVDMASGRYLWRILVSSKRSD